MWVVSEWPFYDREDSMGFVSVGVLGISTNRGFF